MSNVGNNALDEAARQLGEELVPPLFSQTFIATIIRSIDSGHLSASRAARLTDLSKNDLGELCLTYGLDRPAEL
jgi:hypothetical protein